MPLRTLAASLVLILLISACASPQPIPTDPNNAVIYVIGRDWHTDIGLPVDEISPPLTTLKDEFPGVRYLTFGFGERQFLVNRRQTFGAMMNALLPSQSALQMTALQSSPAAAFGLAHVVKLRISQAGLNQIEAMLWLELELSTAGKPVTLADGPYAGSIFYAARSTYDGLYTCNSWTAEALRTGGFAMPVTSVLFASQVMGMARWFATRQSLSTHQE